MNANVSPHGVPLDVNGFELKVGDTVILTPTTHELARRELKADRMKYTGQQSKIVAIHWIVNHGGYWMMELDRYFKPPVLFNRWPADCLTRRSCGLKGLVDRYRNETVRTN